MSEQCDQKLNQLVALTIESGVPPLQLTFTQVNGCYTKRPVAYRTQTRVNSIALGVINYREYGYATEHDDVGNDLAKWSITAALKAAKRFARAGRNIDWISVRCPSNLATDVDLYDFIIDTAAKQKSGFIDKLCLEFPKSLLLREPAAVFKTVSDMAVLKVKTMICGCGAKDMPLTKLADYPLYGAILDKSVAETLSDRNKHDAVPALLGYLKTLGLSLYADGVTDDDQIDAFYRLDCMGYVCGEDYKGNHPFDGFDNSIEFSIDQKEEDYG